MTHRGIFAAVADSLFLALGLATGLKIFYILFAFIGFVLVFSFASVLLASFCIRFRVSLDGDVVKRKETVTCFLNIRGFILLPVTGIFYMYDLGGDFKDIFHRKHYSFFIFPFFGKKTVKIKLFCSHVGIWTVSMEHSRICDVFGMFSLPIFGIKKKSQHCEIEVQPLVYSISNIHSDFDNSPGLSEIKVSTSENGELTGDIREYRYGDSLKRIHWKQTAKMQDIFVRQYEETQSQRLLILVDCYCPVEKKGKLCDLTTEAAISIIRSCSDIDDVVLRCSDVRGGTDNEVFVKTSADFSEALHILASINFTDSKRLCINDAIPDLRSLGITGIWIISAFPSKDFVEELGVLNKMGFNIRLCVPSNKKINTRSSVVKTKCIMNRQDIQRLGEMH